MTRTEQKRFARDLINNVHKSIIVNAHKWPDNWDGHQLRALIARAFADAASMSLITREPKSKLARDFRNTLVVEDLW